MLTSMSELESAGRMVMPLIPNVISAVSSLVLKSATVLFLAGTPPAPHDGPRARGVEVTAPEFVLATESTPLLRARLTGVDVEAMLLDRRYPRLLRPRVSVTFGWIVGFLAGSLSLRVLRMRPVGVGEPASVTATPLDCARASGRPVFSRAPVRRRFCTRTSPGLASSPSSSRTTPSGGLPSEMCERLRCASGDAGLCGSRASRLARGAGGTARRRPTRSSIALRTYASVRAGATSIWSARGSFALSVCATRSRCVRGIVRRSAWQQKGITFSAVITTASSSGSSFCSATHAGAGVGADAAARRVAATRPSPSSSSSRHRLPSVGAGLNTSARKRRMMMEESAERLAPLKTSGSFYKRRVEK